MKNKLVSIIAVLAVTVSAAVPCVPVYAKNNSSILDAQLMQQTEVEFPKTEGEYVYGTKLSDIPLVGGNGNGTFAWENGETVPNVSDKEYAVLFTPADNNETPFTENVAVTIIQAEPTVGENPVIEGLMAGNSVSDGTINIKMSGVDGAEIDGIFSFENEEQTVTAGKNDIAVIFKPNDDNYKEHKFTVSVTVGDDTQDKEIPEYEIPKNLTAEYGKTLADIELPDGFEFESAAETKVGNVGINEFNVKYIPKDTDKYKIVEGIKVEITVTKAAGKVPETKTDIEVDYKVGMTAKEITLAENWAWEKGDTVLEKGKNVLTAVYTPTDTDNFEYNSEDLKVQITIKAVSSDEDDEIVFPETEGKYEYGTKLKDIELVGGKGDGTFEWQKEDTVPNVDNDGYYVVFIPDGKDEYTERKNVEVKIKPIDATLETKPRASAIYVKDKLEESEISGGDIIGIDDEPVKGKYSWVDEDEKFTKSGKYTRDAIFKPTSENYNEIEISLSVTVKSSSSSSSSGGGGSSSGIIVNKTGITNSIHTITATATVGGTVTPLGVSSVGNGKDLTYFINPDGGYIISTIMVDNKLVSNTSSYKFEKVTKDHTIDITFEKIAQTPTVSDEPELNKDSHIAYISGYEDGSFGAEREVTRAETAVILSRLLKNPITEQTVYLSSFSDIPSGKWYSNYIGFIESKGIINGYEDGTFRPDDIITRAEYVAVMARLEKLTGGNVTDFTDVKGHWAEKYISGAVDKGWISGYEDGTFNPDKGITRAEFVKLTNTVLARNEVGEYSYDGLDVKKFTDVDEGHWAYSQIIEAANSHEFEVSNGSEHWSKLK